MIYFGGILTGVLIVAVINYIFKHVSFSQPYDGNYHIYIYRGQGYYLNVQKNNDEYTLNFSKINNRDIWIITKSDDDKAFTISTLKFGNKLYLHCQDDKLSLIEKSTDYLFDESSWFRLENFENGYYLQSLGCNKFIYKNQDKAAILVNDKKKLAPLKFSFAPIIR